MRWIRFNAVGVAGFALQMGTLALLVRWTDLPAGVAVTAAVLVAVTHNFFWHEIVTWPRQPREGRLARWLAFNASTGAVSLATNVGVTALVVTATGVPVVAANVAAVAVASIANFTVSDRLVFQHRWRAAPDPGRSAGPQDQSERRPPAVISPAQRSASGSSTPT